MINHQLMIEIPLHLAGKKQPAYQPPRALEAIDADLDAVSGRIMQLLAEVHS